jgi:hypothetical protein
MLVGPPRPVSGAALYATKKWQGIGRLSLSFLTPIFDGLELLEREIATQCSSKRFLTNLKLVPS